MRRRTVLSALTIGLFVAWGTPAASQPSNRPGPDMDDTGSTLGLQAPPQDDVDVQSERGDPVGAGKGSAPHATAGQIASDPAQFYGKPVQVQAALKDLHGRQLFSLGKHGSAGDSQRGIDPVAQQEVLVMTPRPVPEVRDLQEVTVEGVVRRLSTAELQREYDWFDPRQLEPEMLSRSGEEAVVIVAESIRNRGGQELLPRAPAADAPPAAPEPERR